MASCARVERHIQAYLDNELNAADRLVFEHHVSECTACARRLTAYTATSATLFESFAEVRLRESMHERVMSHLPEMEHHPDHAVWQPQYKPVRFQWLRTLAPALAPILVLLLGITLFYAWPPAEIAHGELLGEVAWKTGQVAKRDAQGRTGDRVSLKTDVFAGDGFETDADAYLALTLLGPTILKADSHTRFQIDGNRKIVLESGRIWLDVADDPQLFRVETPSGGVTVFGTTFDVLVEDRDDGAEARMTVTVAEGSVHVESGVGFAHLQPGQQVAVVRGQRKLFPRQVDADAVMAWAERLEPLSAPDARFAERTVAPIVNDETWSDTMMLVPIDGRQVQMIVLSWLPDAYRAGHSGYHVYVYDSRLNPLFADYIEGSVFDTKGISSYAVTAPDGHTLDQVTGLRIRLVPDRSGAHATTFMEPDVVELR